MINFFKKEIEFEHGKTIKNIEINEDYEFDVILTPKTTELSLDNKLVGINLISAFKLKSSNNVSILVKLNKSDLSSKGEYLEIERFDNSEKLIKDISKYIKSNIKNIS